MDVLIKLVDGEKIILKDVSNFISLDDVWQIEVIDNSNPDDTNYNYLYLYFNKRQVMYIGANDISFY